MRRLSLLLTILIPLGILGCEPAAKKPTEPPPPPVRTAAEIANEIRAPIQQMVTAYMGTKFEIPEFELAAGLNQVRQLKQKNMAEEHGAEGIRAATTDTQSFIKTADESKAWGVVVFACDALKILDPANTNYDRFRERAMVYINMPRVTITGFTKIGDDPPVVLISVYLPETKQTVSERVREGEELLGLRFINIIGNNRGLLIEHIQTGEELEVLYKR